MNSSCSVCDSPSSRVCQHQECSFSPFLCSGPCVKNTSQKMHTHSSQKNFISYEEFKSRIERTNRLLDPYNQHKEYLNEMKKKIKITKDQLKKKIDDCLDQLYKQIERDICTKVKLELSKKEEELVQKINGYQNNSLLCGKDLNQLWGNQYTFANQAKVEQTVESMKKAFDQQLQQIGKLEVKNQSASKNQQYQKSQKLRWEGNELFSRKQYKQALAKYEQIKSINKFDHEIQQNIGDCLFELGVFDKAEQSYKCSFQLQPYFSSSCVKIGHVCQKRNKFEEAMIWYCQAIEIYEQNTDVYTKKGQCLLGLKRFSQAAVDCFKAFNLRPNKRRFKLRQVEQAAFIQ